MLDKHNSTNAGCRSWLCWLPEQPQVAWPKVPCAMNRRVKATGTMDLTQPPGVSTFHISW